MCDSNVNCGSNASCSQNLCFCNDDYTSATNDGTNCVLSLSTTSTTTTTLATTTTASTTTTFTCKNLN